MGVDLFSKLRGSISLLSHLSPSLPSPPSPFPPFPSPALPCREAATSNTARVSGGALQAPQRGPGQSPSRKRILGAFRAQNHVWWQQCDMSHNHSLIINIHYFWWMQCISLCFLTVLQTFCEGPNNGGPLLAKFHEGPDPRTLARSTPMLLTVNEWKWLTLGTKSRDRFQRERRSQS